jgi:hypothetical protein
MLKSRALRWTKLTLLKLTGLAQKEELNQELMLNLVDEFEPTYKYLKSLNINSVLQPSFDRNKDEHIS